MAIYRTLILTAVLPEAQVLIQGLHLIKVAAPVPFWGRDDIALAIVGIRANRLPNVSQMPAIASIRGVLMAGLAGALSPALKVGDVVFAPAAPLPSRVSTHAHTGAIHTADTVVATSADKQKLFAATSCLAVDMETAHAQTFAADRRAAFLTIRAISDAANDALDPSMLRLIDADGNPRIGRAMAMLCRYPSKLPAMLRLQRASSLALTNLSKAVADVIASGWPDAATLPCQTA